MLRVEGEDHLPIFTLEEPWKDNQTSKSCIPSGLYLVAPFSGERFKNTYQVLNVVGRSYILFHVGNYLTDTEGCILLGLESKGGLRGPSVLRSRDAFDVFRKLIGPNNFWLKIQDFNH